MKDLSTLPTWAKFAIAIAYDVLDLFSIPIFGTIYDVIGVPLGVLLWGPIGLANAWEIVDPADAVDRFVPTMTLSGLVAVYGLERK